MFKQSQMPTDTLFTLYLDKQERQTVDPDQIAHYVASDLGLHCLLCLCKYLR